MATDEEILQRGLSVLESSGYNPFMDIDGVPHEFASKQLDGFNVSHLRPDAAARGRHCFQIRGDRLLLEMRAPGGEWRTTKGCPGYWPIKFFAACDAYIHDRQREETS